MKLRVDTETVQPDAIVEILQKNSNMFAYCVEGGDANPHMHAYLELNKTTKTCRNHLRALGLKGNASYSLTELDERYPLEYIAYMMKEGKFTNSGIPEDIIELAKQHNDKVKTEIKKKKEERKTLLQKVENYVVETLKKDPHKFGLQEWIRACVLYVKDSGTLFRMFAIESTAQTLFLKYDDDGEAVNRLSQLVSDRMRI